MILYQKINDISNVCYAHPKTISTRVPVSN
jgi:hypothetical protein